MLLDKLLKKAGIPIITSGGALSVEISDISYDSREIQAGTLYVAIPGTKVHGDSFIADAVSRGASAIVSENPQRLPDIPWVQVRNPRLCVGVLGSVLWSIPHDSIKFVAITGTNGKTTTAHLFKMLFAQMHPVESVWMFGTIEYHIGTLRKAASNTTPEALSIFRHIGLSAEPPKALVMEVSSHSLALDRVGGMSYDCAVWTNLTQDHLDFHKTMENYYLAKRRLFLEHMKKGGCCAINIDDPWGKRLASEIKGINTITYGRAKEAMVRISGWNCDWDGCRIELDEGNTRLDFSSSLRGFFNVYNMTALYAGAKAMGIGPEMVSKAFAAIETVPGRMDRVTIDAPFAVIVDYAHTPDALVNVLTTARPLTKGRLICVFGCGGDRDRTKRPIMGGEVARFSDEAVVTSDNPRSEKPEAIIEEILKGIPLDFPHRVITDRRQAISEALAMAKPGDCIVVAGKGHEDYQEIKGVRHHFNDKEVVAELYASMRNRKHA